MRVRFSKATPYIDVTVSYLLFALSCTVLIHYQVSNVSLLSMNQDISFTKDLKSIADVYEIV
jgi:hypothetical protein